jgi:ATP-dependent DNA ligase
LPGFLLSEGLHQCGRELYAQIMRLGLEGMMAKHLDAPYLTGKRCQHWRKIKPALSRTLQPTALSAGINL